MATLIDKIKSEDGIIDLSIATRKKWYVFKKSGVPLTEYEVAGLDSLRLQQGAWCLVKGDLLGSGEILEARGFHLRLPEKPWWREYELVKK